MTEWSLTRVSEIADIVSGGTPKTEIPEYWNGDIPWLSVKDFAGDTKHVYSSEKTITELGLNNSATQLLFPGDVIISARGTVGEIAQIGKTMAFNQSCYGLRAKEGYSSDYLYYVLKYQIKYLKKVANGAVFDTIILKTFDKMKLYVPDLATQKKIADILSAYDDLIENNLARISLLEKMASELYKEWFVRFRFPGHEAAKFVDGVPEGWEMRKLKELIEFDPLIRMKKGVEYRTIPMDLLSTDSMLIDTSGCEKTTSTSGAHFQNGDTLLARITPCLENGKTGFVNTLDDGETAVGSTEFIVMRSKLLSPHLVYFIARSEYFRKTAINSMNGADGRQRAKISKLQSLSYPLPTRDIIDEFSEIVEPFFEEIKNLNIQNHNLTKQRDLLLPRLMSGKLSVEPLLGQTA